MPRRPTNHRPDLNGLLVIDKPLGVTSFAVCRSVRRLTRGAKVGHAGALDPLATGVLILALGKATKAIDRLMATEKRYLADLDLASFSTTDDGEGEFSPVAVKTPPSHDAIERAIASFVGVIDQQPPIFSAVHIAGERAHKLARKGKLVDRPPSRPVVIHSIGIVQYDWPALTLDIRCGKGTYIRSLARDLGERLHTGGMLTALQRTAVGPYTINDATTLDALPDEVEAVLQPIPPTDGSEDETTSLSKQRAWPSSQTNSTPLGYTSLMPDCRNKLESTLYDLVLENLARLHDYIPGPVKKAGGTKEHLIRAYAADPMFSIFGLDSPEYIAAKLSGGTITSIHRKLGDIYEALVKLVFHYQLSLSMEDLTYRARIMSGSTEETRTADVFLRFDEIRDTNRRRVVQDFAAAELAMLAAEPRIELIGIGMEVRHCYQTNDSKRTQADEAMARHLLVSGILPLMPLFCNQSAQTIIRRYRSVWVVKEGLESYGIVKELSGFDLYDFMKRNRDDFRKPVIRTLRGLQQ